MKLIPPSQKTDVGITGGDTVKSLAWCLARREHPIIVERQWNESRRRTEFKSVAEGTGGKRCHSRKRSSRQEEGDPWAEQEPQGFRKKSW